MLQIQRSFVGLGRSNGRQLFMFGRQPRKYQFHWVNDKFTTGGSSTKEHSRFKSNTSGHETKMRRK